MKFFKISFIRILYIIIIVIYIIINENSVLTICGPDVIKFVQRNLSEEWEMKNVIYWNGRYLV